MRNLGGSIGISVFEAVLIQNTQIVHSRLVEHLRPDNPLARAPFLSAPFSLTNPSGIAALNAEVTRQAAMVAYIDVYTFHDDHRDRYDPAAARGAAAAARRGPAPARGRRAQAARRLNGAAASHRIRSYQPRDLNGWQRSNFPYHSLLSPSDSFSRFLALA